MQIIDPHHRLSRNPRHWPDNLKQAIAGCCCGGSGSGSGSGGGGGTGLIQCCGCFSFPDTLAASVTVSCIGSKTVTLTKNTVLSTECVDNPGVVSRVVYGYTETHGTHDDFWSAVDCATGLIINTEGGIVEDFLLTIDCCPLLETTPPIKKWTIELQWNKHDAGTQKIIHYKSSYDVASCDPLTFDTVDKTVVCYDSITYVAICGNSGPTGDYFDEPYCNYTNCVGSTCVINISE